MTYLRQFNAGWAYFENRVGLVEIYTLVRPVLLPLFSSMASSQGSLGYCQWHRLPVSFTMRKEQGLPMQAVEGTCLSVYATVNYFPGCL